MGNSQVADGMVSAVEVAAEIICGSIAYWREVTDTAHVNVAIELEVFLGEFVATVYLAGQQL